MSKIGKRNNFIIIRGVVIENIYMKDIRLDAEL